MIVLLILLLVTGCKCFNADNMKEELEVFE